MKKHLFEGVRISNRWLPAVLLAVCLLAFGLLIPWLGFYQDDWHVIYYAHQRGVNSLWEMFRYDTRPYAAWPYILAFPLLGFKPLGWHVLGLLVRWQTVLAMWGALRMLWPEQPRQVAWAALLFAVYPIFKLQPLAVIYLQHWVGYLLFALSLLSMIAAFRRPAYFWLFTALALAAEAAHLFTNEYFSGAEFVRPAILWVLLAWSGPSLGKRLGKAVLHWTPYLLVSMGYAYWRVFLAEVITPKANLPTLLFDLFRAPLVTLPRLLTVILQDGTHMLVNVWANTVAPPAFDLSPPVNRLVLFLIAACGIGLALLMNRMEAPQPGPSGGEWAAQGLLVGLVATFAGPLPAWITEQGITINNPLWSDRFGLASMFGAALTVVALIDWLVKHRRQQTVLLALLVAFAAGWHIRYTNEYRLSWQQQTGFYRQLAWRVPALEPRTAILTTNEPFAYMGYYPTSYALNNLYLPPADTRFLNTWLFGLFKDFGDRMPQLLAGMEVRDKHFDAVFVGQSTDSLVVDYEPEQGQCLWILRPEDAPNKLIPDLTRAALPLSSSSRIHAEGEVPVSDFLARMGVDLSPDWCYYYQKAELARQTSDWEGVLLQWEAAQQAGMQPHSGYELIPFIEANAHTGNWQAASDLTDRARALTLPLRPLLCAIWDALADQPSSPADRDAILPQVAGKLACPEK